MTPSFLRGAGRAASPLFLAALAAAPLHAEWSVDEKARIRARVPARPRTLVLGRSQILVEPGARVGAQVDRVVRDIHWTDSPFDARVPPDRVPQSPAELVPYMEGARLAELMRYAKVRVLPLTPALVQPKKNGHSYGLGTDGEGRPRFVIDISKMEYATVKARADGLLEMPDTHGFNAVAAAAMRVKPDLVVACLDMPSKAEAALYLARNGMAGYGSTDRFAYELLGYRTLFPKAAMILGSAPIRAAEGGAVIGNQPVAIGIDEPIVAQWTDRQSYPWQYNDAPWRYFSHLAELYGLPLKLTKATADAGHLEKVLEIARARAVNVVAVRVGKANNNEEAAHDARQLAAWLQESPQHRAVLFHTAAYEPGYELFFHYPAQTTFGDLDPRFE